MVEVKRTEFFLAALQRFEIAKLLHSERKNPTVIAYLCHVTVECLLKSWILYKANRSTTRDFLQKMGQATEWIFASARGHNLNLLAQHANLMRLLTTENAENLLQSTGWKSLIGSNRPYDARYGAIKVSLQTAEEELDVVQRISDVVRKNMP